MARFLALDWDQQQLYLASASTSRSGAVTVERALAAKEDPPLNLVTAEALGQRLRELLKEHKLAPAPVVACVGRDRVILKEILYPPVPAHEEPAVVRFQALKQLTHAPEEVVIDYHPVGDTGPNGERRALVLVLRKELLATYQALCKAAGLKLVALTPRPFGLAACVQHATRLGLAPAPDAPEAAQAVLAVSDRWAEFCVLRGGVLLFSRSMATPSPGLEAALLGEIRRNLVVYAGQSPQNPVRALYLADGGARGRLADLLKESLAVPVHAVDVLAGAAEPLPPAEQRGSFAGAVGAVRAHVAGGVAINFLEPKQPRPQRDPNRTRLAAGVAAAVALLLGLVGFAYSTVVRRDREIEDLTRAKLQLEGNLVLIEEEARRIKAIDEWAGTEIVWLDELYDLTERFPDGNAVRLVQLAGDPLTRTGKSKHAAKLSLKGVSTSDYQPVETLQAHLVEEGYYRVEPKVLVRNSGTDRSRFPQQFSTRVDIEPRPPSAYQLRLRAKPPEAAPAAPPINDDDLNFDQFGGQP